MRRRWRRRACARWVLGGLLLPLGHLGCAGPPVVVGTPSPGARPGLAVRYVANEGFLVEGGGRRVLVDALIAEEVAGYAALPADLRQRLEGGTGGWGGVDVALASHHHGDHFDAASTRRFLAANPEAVFVSTPQAIERLRAAAAGEPGLLDRVHAVLPAEAAVERLELAGVRVEVLNLHHGRRQPPVQNLGFVVTLGGLRFLHFGDTEAKMETFEPYLDRLGDADLALLPFWFLASEWRAGLVRERLRPRRIVVGHLPTPSAPPGHFGRWRNHRQLVEVIRAGFPDAVLPSRAGEALGHGEPEASPASPGPAPR